MVNAFRLMVFVIGLAVVIGCIMVISADNPTITIYSPSNGDTFYTKTITVTGGANRGKDGAVVGSVTVNGKLAEGTTSWRKVISLQPGSNSITAVAMDRYGNPSMPAAISVIYESTPTPTPTNTTIPNGNHRTTPIPTATPTIPMPTGSISITTSPSGAAVDWDGSFAGNTSITLEDVVGHHKVRISKEGFHSVTMDIDLYKGITTKRIIELEPITGSIVVYSKPSGASVYLDDDDMNKITPCMLNEVVVGNHTIRLTKSGYFNRNKSVFVSTDEQLSLNETLTRCGYINISSDPSGAEVYLDGNNTGETTPANISEVELGNHTIELKKLSYDNEEIKVDVSVAKTDPVQVNLSGYGIIDIASDPNGASVYLDGNYTRKTTPTNISKVVGNYSIRLRKLDYEEVTKDISVSAGKTTFVSEGLSLLLWKRIYGPATLIATVFIAFFEFIYIRLVAE